MRISLQVMMWAINGKTKRNGIYGKFITCLLLANVFDIHKGI